MGLIMELKKVKAAELRQKPLDQVLSLRSEWRKNLIEEKLSPLGGVSGQAKIKHLKKAIARLETVLTETRKKSRPSK